MRDELKRRADDAAKQADDAVKQAEEEYHKHRKYVKDRDHAWADQSALNRSKAYELLELTDQEREAFEWFYRQPYDHRFDTLRQFVLNVDLLDDHEALKNWLQNKAFPHTTFHDFLNVLSLAVEMCQQERTTISWTATIWIFVAFVVIGAIYNLVT